MRYIDYGLGVYRKKAFDHVPVGIPFDLAMLYRELLADGQLAAQVVRERFYKTGSRSGLDETRKFLAARCGARQ